jgi:SAM-dependent methyltransferase
MTGVDLSSAMIAAARASEAEEPLDIAYQVGSFARLDGFADASFDAAVSTMALMDCPDFAATARSAHRVLRPGGSLWFSVLHPCFLTPGSRWLDGDRRLAVAEYFSDRAWVERWRFSKAPETSGAEPFRVPRFGWRLENYLGGLCAAGLRIVRIAEPRPSAAQCREYPWLARWRRHAARLLLVGARKA